MTEPQWPTYGQHINTEAEMPPKAELYRKARLYEAMYHESEGEREIIEQALLTLCRELDALPWPSPYVQRAVAKARAEYQRAITHRGNSDAT